MLDCTMMCRTLALVVLVLGFAVDADAASKRQCKVACRDTMEQCRRFQFTKASCRRRFIQACRRGGTGWCGPTRVREVRGVLPADVLNNPANVQVNVQPGRVIRINATVVGFPNVGTRFLCGWSLTQGQGNYTISSGDTGSCFIVDGPDCDFFRPAEQTLDYVMGCTASIDLSQPFTLVPVSGPGEIVVP